MALIAIDFETANEERGSACAIGLAWVENGEVKKTEERLIRPKDMRFAGMNISIHGITPEQVADKPEFPTVLAEFESELNQSCVLAHNAAFDISVIRATLDKYNLPYPEFNFVCTAKIARRVWPDLLSASLTEVAHLLGIEFEHHKAAADAYVSGMIAIAAMKKVGVADILDASRKLQLTPGHLSAANYMPCSARGPKLSQVTPTVTTIPRNHPLFGRKVVFTGALQRMERKEAAQMAVNAGAQMQNNIRMDTDTLVISNQALSEFVQQGVLSNKLAKVRKMVKEGFPIEIMSEDDFYRLF